jgi:hypothetical protein
LLIPLMDNTLIAVIGCPGNGEGPRNDGVSRLFIQFHSTKRHHHRITIFALSL